MPMTSSANAAACSLPIAPLWRRLAAMFYDTLLSLAILMVTGTLYITIKVALFGAPYVEEHNQGYDPLLTSLMLFSLFFFFSLCWRSNGQTLGMQAWRIRVQSEHGKVISWWQCLLRFLSAGPAIGLAGLGLWWSLIDNEQRTWQDRFSVSRVVLLPKN